MSLKEKSISATFSAYLDLLRLAAAFFVLLFHIKKLAGPIEITKFIPDHGHDAVILFFVLSGYVIAATADRKQDDGLRGYILDRVARVYSVAIPALILSALLALGFQSVLDPGNPYSLQQLTIDSSVNFFFIGQSWSLKNWVYFNQPYWSLCYEVMYYLGYGVFFFFKGWKKWIGILIVCLIAGPKVLLLLPCWALGVLTYHMRDKLPLQPRTALILAFLLPPLILVNLHVIGFGPMVRGLSFAILGDQKNYLEFSNDFLVDYVTAVLVAFNLYCARYVTLNIPNWIMLAAKKWAGISFTLYIMHLPLIYLIVNIAGVNRNSIGTLLIAAIGVPIICNFIAELTEHKRPQLRQWLDQLFPRSQVKNPGLEQQ